MRSNKSFLGSVTLDLDKIVRASRLGQNSAHKVAAPASCTTPDVLKLHNDHTKAGMEDMRFFGDY